jgi:UDP-N-acetylglucosamine 2-epimerase (non-hydrolysing)
MHILHVVGARPNFMKAAPVMRELACRTGIRQTLVHTGQHYDSNMSDIFFRQLDMPVPQVNLAVGSGSHAGQTAQVMQRIEPVLLECTPDLVLVYGDVNSTVAAALVCAQLQIPVGHVEAGLRSFDRTMPEEINRLLTDQLADLLFTPSSEANENLGREGIPPGRVHLVGNVMIDTLVSLRAASQATGSPDPWLETPHAPTESLQAPGRGPINKNYGLVSLHRPSNVDDPASLGHIVQTLLEISQQLPLVFPVHPRTRQRLRDLPLPMATSDLRLVEPLGYLEFLNLQAHALLVITDSGGVQEETTYLGVPCLTVRENTERPVTVTLGTNVLVGQDMSLLRANVDKILAGERKPGRVPPKWDGHTAWRIARVIKTWWRQRQS